jgi:hypothetical protein
MIRSILAIVLGILIATIVTWVVQFPCAVLYPLPKELSPDDTEAFRAYVATLPVGAFLLVLLSWFAGAFCGAWLAARIVRRLPLVHALIVAAVQLAAGLYELLRLPHPTWFLVASLLVFPLAAIAAAALNRPKAAPPPVAA